MNPGPILQSEVNHKEKDTYCILTHIMESRRMVPMILHARQQRIYRHKKQTFGLSGISRGWDDLRK